MTALQVSAGSTARTPVSGNSVLRTLTQMPTKTEQFSSHKEAPSEQIQLWPRRTRLPGEPVTSQPSQSHRRLLIRRGRLGGPLTNGLGYNQGVVSAASSGGHGPNNLPVTQV